MDVLTLSQSYLKWHQLSIYKMHSFYVNMNKDSTSVFLSMTEYCTSIITIDYKCAVSNVKVILIDVRGHFVWKKKTPIFFKTNDRMSWNFTNRFQKKQTYFHFPESLVIWLHKKNCSKVQEISGWGHFRLIRKFFVYSRFIYNNN